MMNSTELANAVDRMLQGTRQHHVQLSMMADTKASMLITLSSLVITLSVPQLMEPTFRTAAVILIVCCLATVGLATYAAMPKTPLRTSGRPDVADPHFNILFFGDFTRLDYPDFEENMFANMQDGEHIYQLMLKEIYTMGAFLAHKKYRYLRLASISFMTGFLASALTLALQLFLA
ncbi:MAG: hypothetical protein HYV16_07020 [Gammaproteobacteria bacterium]|nr:hypothetical protein [Gammaproteobacteria bacterium]